MRNKTPHYVALEEQSMTDRGDISPISTILGQKNGQGGVTKAERFGTIVLPGFP